jgi:cytochrome c-type biogenesis protein CcmH/NrfG
VGFWRRQVIDFALDHETRRHMEEQVEWIEREPANPRPYVHLAQFYRIQGKQDEALALLLEAVRRDPRFAEAHVALAEIYAVRADYTAAWRHARAGERGGDGRAVEMLTRHGVPD